MFHSAHPYLHFLRVWLTLLALLAAWPAQAVFTDNSDGTVSDSATGLIWDKCSWGQSDNTCATGSASTHTWAAALRVAVTANTANYKGHNDWRLPNRLELESLVKIDAYNPAIDLAFFPPNGLDSLNYWSSTYYKKTAPTGPTVFESAWFFNFYSGASDSGSQISDFHVRLVRSGQSFDTSVAPTYTKIANNGSELADTAVLGSAPTDWACTRDNATGLIWEVKTTSGLRNKDNTYSNYDNLTQEEFFFPTANSNYRQPTQVEIDDANNSIGFINAVNTNTSALCGFRDWKMPSKNELRALYPKINANTALFPNSQNDSLSSFWSDTPDPDADSSSLYVDFGNGTFGGTDNTYSQGNPLYVRLVRSGLLSGTFALTLSASGSGSGNITSSIGSSTTSSGVSSNIANRIVSSINCTSTAGTTSGACTTSLTEGTSVVLTATPATGSTFSGWSGACAGSLSPCTVLIAALKSVTANFTLGAVAPTVTAISPTSGGLAGGTAVTITGTDLTGATAVTIGGAACSAFAVVSATSITCTTPAGTSGAKNVLVTTPAGVGTGSGLFTYSAPAYTKIANNGSALADSAALGSAASDWACTRDNVTGLVWEVKTTSDLRSKLNTYTNYDDLTQVEFSGDSGYRNPTQVEIDDASNSIGFVNAVNTNSSALCGFRDWKMPSKDELVDLYPKINANTVLFPNSPAALFWSGTPDSPNPAYAWVVSFFNGNTYADFQGFSYLVRLVRSGQSLGTFALTLSGSGTGSGNITSTSGSSNIANRSLGNINCTSTAGTTSDTCTTRLAEGTSVVLTATPATGSTFTGWSGACAGNLSPCTVLIAALKSVTATFTLGAVAPTVTAISPTSGGLAGGTAVTITGTDLTGATAVTIGGAACSAFAVVSATSITCTTPAGTSGAKNVLVTTPAGVGTGSALFTYQAPAYTKIANNGSELADTAILGSAPTDWACTRDNVSGLVWEVKTTSGLRNQDTLYTNYDDLTQAAFFSGGPYRNPTQVEIDAANNSIGFINAVNTNTSALCGFRDWKMPSIEELRALYPKINANTALFPNSLAAWFWSGTPVVGNETYAWQFDFRSGNSSNDYGKEDFEVIRLVRSGLSLGNFALTLSASGSGSGNITSSIGSSTTSSGVSSNIANRIVSSINCTSTAGTTSGACTTSLTEGTSVVLTATPATGSTFTGWSGACAGSLSPCTVLIAALKSVTANFSSTINSYALTATANPVAGGTVSCTPNPVNSGSSSTCTATPASGYHFSAWSGDCTGATCVLSNVTAAKTVIASFTPNDITPNPFSFTPQTGVPLSTTITSNPITVSGINVPVSISVNNGRYSINGGTFVNIIGSVSSDDTVLVNIISASTAGAVKTAVLSIGGESGSFTVTTRNAYAVTATASPTAGGSASCTPNPVNSGSNSTCTATPASGYRFSTWSGDCTGATCVLSNITSAKSVTASFTQNSYALTATANPVAGGSASCTPNPVNSGSNSTCTATPASGYRFSTWSGDCTGATCVLSNITSAKSVTASFTQNSYSVTASASPTAGGSASCTPNPVNSGGSSTCTAVAATGYHFTGWSGDCAAGSGTGSCSLTNVTAAKSVTAGFTANTYIVSANAIANGSISPTVQTINHGAPASFTITPNNGYGIASATGCSGGLSGKTYTTGPITANCSVTVVLSATPSNGACGTDSGATPLSSTPLNLCTTGTASLVYGSGPWNWTCAGSNGGSNASCSATASSYIVTASVSGSGGTISPASRTVAHNGVTTFTVSPSGGNVINTVTSRGCSGNLSGTLYTTSAVTENCTVSATFTTTNTTTTISGVTPSPSKVGQSVTIAYGVSNAGSGSDTVTVKDGVGSTLCTGTVSGGTCNAIFSSSGAKTLIASYAGSAQASDSPGTNHLVADSPALATPTLPSGVVGVPYATMLVASGGVPPYAFTSSALPAGFSLSSSGLLSGTASAVAAPTVRITVTDHLAQSAYQDYTLSLVAQLTVATTSLPDGLVNAPYDQTLQAVGGKTPYVWSVTSGTLPDGLALDAASGQLSGQPTNLGTSAAFTVQVQDANARTANQVLSLTTLQPTVRKTNGSTTLSGNLTPSDGGSTCTLDDSQTRVLHIGDSGAPTGAPSNITLPYGLFKMTVQGCTPGQTKLSVKLVYPAALPPGTQYWKYGKTADNHADHWYVLPSAVIAGNTVSFTITDGGLGDDDLTADGSITDPGAAGNPMLAISGTPGSGQVGSRYSATLTPSNGSGPYNWSMASGGLPNGVVLNAGTGQLSGTPTQAGTFNFTVQLVDTFNSQNASTTRGFAITMANAAASYALTANASPIAGGSASCMPNLVTAGGNATCTATPAAGYTFSTWSGDCTGTTCVLSNVQTAMNVTANFTASNMPPSANAVSITGNTQVGQTLTGSYTYSDADGDLEDVSIFQWYADSAANGNTKVIRSGATATTTTVQSSDLGQFLFFCVTPQALTGTSPGSKACSEASAQISAASIAALITSGAPPKGTVGTPYRFTVTASGTPLISFSASGLPPGLSLDASSGLLSGTPSTAGSYSVTLSASNTPASGSAAKDVQVYTMLIEPAFAAAPASIPTLSEWGMILLSGLIALFGFGQMRRRHG